MLSINILWSCYKPYFTTQFILYIIAVVQQDEAFLNIRGEIMRLTSRYEEAISFYTAALEINARYTLAFINRGVCYAALGRLDEAVGDWEYASKIDAANIDAHLNLGLACREKGDFSSSALHFGIIHQQLQGSNPDLMFQYGVSLQLTGRLRDAELIYINLLKADPGSDRAKMNLAATYQVLQHALLSL